jgi:hypothetical protein
MRNWFKRPGHATVVAYLALFLAIGGGTFAIAKGGKINGSKLKKRSVAGKKLKKNTITGTEVNENKLGKVPSAKAADTATTAGSASVAGSVATESPNTNTKLVSSTTATTREEARAAAPAVTLYEDSQFRIYAKCFNFTTPESRLEGVIFLATKQDGAIFDASEDELSGDLPDGYLNVASPEELREVDNISVLAGNTSIEEAELFGATALNGYTLIGYYQISLKSGVIPAGDGPYGPGEVCLFGGYVNHS